MIAAWMVSLSGWLLVFLAVLAVAGLVLVGLLVWDEYELQKQRRDIRRREQQRAKDRSR